MQRLRDKSLLADYRGNCKYKYVCGRCGARALGYFDDFIAPERRCIRELEEPSVRRVRN